MQTFYDHVNELRGRLFWVAMAVIIGGTIGYIFRVPLINFIQKPLDAPLFYSKPGGSFDFVMQICYMLGIFVALPVIAFHLIRFMEPALPVPIKKFTILKVITASLTLAFAGAAFGYFVIMPLSLHFFAGYSSDVVQPLISASDYLGYTIGVLVVFMLLSQIPLLILFINRIKPIKPSKLLHYQRHVIAGSFLIAVLVPFTYEPITQFAIAMPMIVLYYMSLLLVWGSNKRRKVVYDQEPEKVKDVTPESAPALAPALPQPVAMAAPRVSAKQPVRRMRSGVQSQSFDAVKRTPRGQFKPLDLSGQA